MNMSAFSPAAFHVPSDRTFASYGELSFGVGGDVRLSYPELTQEDVAGIIGDLRVAHREVLANMPIFEVVDILDEVVRRWRDPDYWLRQHAIRLLPVVTNYSPEMVAAGLKWLDGFNGDSLRRVLRDEVGDPRYLDGFRPRRHAPGLTRAFGPEVSTHVFSGNVPGVCVLSLVSGLLTKSACLGKAATEEPLFPVLFARSLAEVSPELGRCMAILYWKGGTTEIEDVAFAMSDAVFAYGGDEAIGAIRQRLGPDVPFVGYGHKIGFQMVSRQVLTEANAQELARRAAMDVSFYDQQGCLSPHVLYLERGGEVTPKAFAKILADEMEAFNQAIPRGPLDASETIAINGMRETYEFKTFVDDDVAVFASKPGTDWTVILDTDPAFEPTCNNRVIRIKPLDDLDEVPALVAPHRHFLQTVGAAVPDAQLQRLGAQLGRLGANRICPLGTMGRPEYWWHHDGRPNFAEFLRWVDIDADPAYAHLVSDRLDDAMQARLDALLERATEQGFQPRSLPQRVTAAWIDAMERHLDDAIARRADHELALRERLGELMERAERCGVRVHALPDRLTERWLAKLEQAIDEARG